MSKLDFVAWQGFGLILAGIIIDFVQDLKEISLLHTDLLSMPTTTAPTLIILGMLIVTPCFIYKTWFERKQ